MTDQKKVFHVGRPNIPPSRAFLDYVDEIFSRKWLTNNGPLVQTLEEELRKKIGVKNAVLVCNATIGMQLLIRACEIRGPVALPAYTFAATAQAAIWQGCSPVFCDVLHRDHNIDVSHVENALQSGAKAIIGVHLWGQPCDVARLSRLSREYKVPLLLDAAHAFECTCEGKPIGGFGTAEVFSFHATKFFNTCEGGCITTNDDELAGKLRELRNFGFVGVDKIIRNGTNAKLSELHAAMGLALLPELETIRRANKRNYEVYEENLSSSEAIRMLRYSHLEKNNHQYVVLCMNPDATKMTRDKLVAALENRGVMARKYFSPGCHKLPEMAPNSAEFLPVTEFLCENVLVMPNGPQMSEDDVAAICGFLKSSIGA